MSVPLDGLYLGLALRSPLVASASPATGSLAGLEQLQEAGVAAAVLPSLFEEQIRHEEWQLHALMLSGSESSAEASGYFPELIDYNAGPDAYLELVRAASEQLEIPVIGSLNGHTEGGWTAFAREIEEAGARALELNLYLVPVDAEASAQQVENRYLDIVRAVREAVDLPIAVKLGPSFSSLPGFVGDLARTGADGAVLFNRFLEPDIDLETLEVVPRLELSRSYESLQALRWIAILRKQCTISLAATGGAHDWEDVLKLVLAGADAVLLASVLLREGPGRLAELERGLSRWLEEHEYESLEQARGSLCRDHVPDPQVYERLNYMKALLSYSATMP